MTGDKKLPIFTQFKHHSRFLQKAPGEEKKKKDKGDKEKKRRPKPKPKSEDESDEDGEGWETVDRYLLLIISSFLEFLISSCS